MDCKGKVAIVTGAAGSGMGRSIALTLARQGASVIIDFLNGLDRAAALVETIEHHGGSSLAVQADVFDEEGCQKLVEKSIERFGQVDICVIGPGAGWHPQSPDQLDPIGALEDLVHELAPLYYLMPRLLPGMYARKWGRLIGIAMHPLKLSPAYAYNSAKAARLQAFLLAHEQAWQHGVTVNVIAPGPVTAVETLEKAVELSEHGTAWRDRNEITPQDIAEGMAFLCSDAGRYISGCILPYLFNG